MLNVELLKASTNLQSSQQTLLASLSKSKCNHANEDRWHFSAISGFLLLDYDITLHQFTLWNHDITIEIY